MPDPHDTEEFMEDTNGAVSRIKRVLQRNEKIDQDVVNDLMLEAIAENNQLIREVGRLMDKHIGVHREIGEEHIITRDQIAADAKLLDQRVKRIENIVLFPANHPRVTALIAFSTFLLMNFWFVSGFRQLILQALNAPDWLIQLLVPGFIP